MWDSIKAGWTWFWGQSVMGMIGCVAVFLGIGYAVLYTAGVHLQARGYRVTQYLPGTSYQSVTNEVFSVVKKPAVVAVPSPAYPVDHIPIYRGEDVQDFGNWTEVVVGEGEVRALEFEDGPKGKIQWLPKEGAHCDVCLDPLDGKNPIWITRGNTGGASGRSFGNEAQIYGKGEKSTVLFLITPPSPEK